MDLAPGARLGSYVLHSQLGAGGMGIVYRARDIRLDRDVALKILPSDWARDPERLARFEREARILASLNHPGLAVLLEAFEAEDRHVLVLELVEGPTLADRIRSPAPLSGDGKEGLTGAALSIDETVSVFVQIAAGLEAAHDRGVVHRDLTPANIKVPPDGRVRILDFGIATSLSLTEMATEDRARASTLLGLTADAVILGTPAYMSPEQARGIPVDKRTDIWAYGCCLFEALTGRPAFAAGSVSDTIARVLKDEPDWTALPEALPQALRVLLARCLRKDQKRRLRDIGDARIELEEAIAGAAGVLSFSVRDVDFKAMLVGRIVNLPAISQSIGMAATTELMARCEALVGESVKRYHGVGGERTPDGFTATFELPSDAVRCALTCQTEVARLGDKHPLALAIGIHAAEMNRSGGERAPAAGGHVLDTALRVAGLARPGQILLTGAAAEAARWQVATVPDGSGVLWMDHGLYLFKDLDGPQQIVEAGVVGLSALSRPADTETARRAPKPRLVVRPIYRPAKT